MIKRFESADPTDDFYVFVKVMQKVSVYVKTIE